jgi:peptidoglycan hydrolase-like protein with peptidoglycan-binding domain
MSDRIKAEQRAFGQYPTGERTAGLDQAIRAFQAARGLKADGIVGPRTWASLWRDQGVDIIVDLGSVKGWGERTRSIRGIVFHHSDTGNPASTVRALNSKLNSTHYEVSATGAVYWYGDPLEKVAWHTGTANGTGIGLDGTHRKGKPWPAEQLTMIRRVMAVLCLWHGLDPRWVDAPKWVKGRGDTVIRTDASKDSKPLWGGDGDVTGHYHWASTLCPDNFPVPDLSVEFAAAQAVALEHAAPW